MTIGIQDNVFCFGCFKPLLPFSNKVYITGNANLFPTYSSVRLCNHFLTMWGSQRKHGQSTKKRAQPGLKPEPSYKVRNLTTTNLQSPTYIFHKVRVFQFDRNKFYSFCQGAFVHFLFSAVIILCNWATSINPVYWLCYQSNSLFQMALEHKIQKLMKSHELSTNLLIRTLSGIIYNTKGP